MEYIEEKLDFIMDGATKRGVRNAIAVLNRSLRTGKSETTEFLNPAEGDILTSILSKYEIPHLAYGGYEQAERRVFLFGEDIDAADFVSALETQDLDSDINHRDVLGALLSLGLDRGSIGDIQFGENGCELLIHRTEESNVIYNLNSIRRYKCRFSLKSTPELSSGPAQLEDFQCIVASLRLDALLAPMLSTSRGKAKMAIKSGRVKLNHIPCTDPDREVQEGDEISIRGVGRFSIGDTGRTTRKGRIVVQYAKRI